MSRSGYSDDCDGWDLIRWRGAVTSAIKGRRGQAALKEILAAFDAMPVKELISGHLEENGQFCTLGVLGHARGTKMDDLCLEDRDGIGERFSLAPAMVAEIEAENDLDFCYWKTETPAERWTRMREWIASQIKAEPQP